MTQAPRADSPIFKIYFEKAAIATEKALNVLLPDVVAKASYVDARHVRGGRGARKLAVERWTVRQKPRCGCGDVKSPNTRLSQERRPSPATQWCARAPVLRYKGGRPGRGPARYVSAQHVPSLLLRSWSILLQGDLQARLLRGFEEMLFHSLTELSPLIFVSVVSRRVDTDLCCNLYLLKMFLCVISSRLALGRQARRAHFALVLQVLIIGLRGLGLVP